MGSDRSPLRPCREWSRSARVMAGDPAAQRPRQLEDPTGYLSLHKHPAGWSGAVPAPARFWNFLELCPPFYAISRKASGPLFVFFGGLDGGKENFSTKNRR